jgi:hypothetical protein
VVPCTGTLTTCSMLDQTQCTMQPGCLWN